MILNILSKTKIINLFCGKMSILSINFSVNFLIIKMIKNKRKYLPKQNNYNAKAKIQINKHQTKLNDKK